MPPPGGCCGGQRGRRGTRTNRDGWLLQSRVRAELADFLNTLLTLVIIKMSGHKLGSGILYNKTSKEKTEIQLCDLLLVVVRFQMVFDIQWSKLLRCHLHDVMALFYFYQTSDMHIHADVSIHISLQRQRWKSITG